MYRLNLSNLGELFLRIWINFSDSDAIMFHFNCGFYFPSSLVNCYPMIVLFIVSSTPWVQDYWRNFEEGNVWIVKMLKVSSTRSVNLNLKLFVKLVYRLLYTLGIKSRKHWKMRKWADLLRLEKRWGLQLAVRQNRVDLS